MRLRALLGPLAPPLCLACGAHAGRTEPLCGPCRRALPWLGPEPFLVGGVPAWAPLAYRGGAAAVVRALKFRGAVDLAGEMAAQIAAPAPPGWFGSGVLVPVPLHPARRRRRGFNQAALLARALAGRTGLALAEPLRRSGSRGTQVGRGGEERRAALAGTVVVAAGAGVPEECVLVDDVATTGATLDACASALLAGGAHTVRAVTYARTGGR